MGHSTELALTIEFDEYTAWEVKQKGWFACAFARLPDGREVPLSFWDPIRLAQVTQSTFESGQGYFAEPGTIIVPEITLEAMQQAVTELAKTDYFDHFVSRVPII